MKINSILCRDCREFVKERFSGIQHRPRHLSLGKGYRRLNCRFADICEKNISCARSASHALEDCHEENNVAKLAEELDIVARFPHDQQRSVHSATSVMLYNHAN